MSMMAGFTDWATPAHAQQRLMQAATFAQAVQAVDPRLTVEARDVMPLAFRIEGQLEGKPGVLASVAIAFEGDLYRLGAFGVEIAAEMLLVALVNDEQLAAATCAAVSPPQR